MGRNNPCQYSVGKCPNEYINSKRYSKKLITHNNLRYQHLDINPWHDFYDYYDHWFTLCAQVDAKIGHGVLSKIA